MNTAENNLVSLEQEREKRIHDLHEANLQKLRKAFEKALPLPKTKAKKRKKKGSR